MLNPSDISTPSDFALEREREGLRDRRSFRFCEKVDTIAAAIAKVIGALVSAVMLAHILGWL
jgi:hypothetical protein